MLPIPPTIIKNEHKHYTIVNNNNNNRRLVTLAELLLLVCYYYSMHYCAKLHIAVILLWFEL